MTINDDKLEFFYRLVENEMDNIEIVLAFMSFLVCQLPPTE